MSTPRLFLSHDWGLLLRGRWANLTLGFKSNPLWPKGKQRSITKERFKSEVAYRSDPLTVSAFSI